MADKKILFTCKCPRFFLIDTAKLNDDESDNFWMLYLGTPVVEYSLSKEELLLYLKGLKNLSPENFKSFDLIDPKMFFDFKNMFLEILSEDVVNIFNNGDIYKSHDEMRLHDYICEMHK